VYKNLPKPDFFRKRKANKPVFLAWDLIFYPDFPWPVPGGNRSLLFVDIHPVPEDALSV